MKVVLGALIALLAGTAVMGVLALRYQEAAARERDMALAAEEARAELHALEQGSPEPGASDELQELRERFDALQAEHERVLARLHELEDKQAPQPGPLPYTSLAEGVAYWKALLADGGSDLSRLELLQAMTAQPELIEFLLVDPELDRDVREFAADALLQLDEESQASIMDSIFADHGLQEEIGRTRIALIDAMSGFEDPRSLRHLSQLNALIDSQNEPGLDHYAAIVLTSHDGADADAAFELLLESDSAWVQKSLPVLKALHTPYVDHGAFIISPTVDGYFIPGDAVVECNGQKIEGWKDLKRLVEATDKETLLPFVVVDVNGEWQTRHVPGRADLRCLGRDL